MKKTLAVLMMVLLLAMLIVSCEADSPVIIHKVTFNSDNGSEAKVESVIDGEKTVKPADPVMTGYTFLGWYDGDTLFDFETSVKQDYSLTAKWQIQTFTVSFDVNGGEGSYEPLTINYGDKIDTTKVSNPTRTEYTFLGWFDGENKVDLATLIVTKDYELKAKWNINSYTVTFDSDGGTPYDPQSVEYNNTTTSPGIPEKDGYTFMGWYNGKTEFVFDTPITENITLKAKWGYTVTFNSNGGSTVDSVVVEQNSTVTKPAVPTKEGQVFVGWYDGENKFNFDSAITKKTELTAKWRDPYTVTFNVEGNTTTIASKKDNGDGKVEAPTDNPTKAGWVFDHWSTEKNGTKAFDFKTVLTGDITLYAVFRDYYIVGDIGPAGGTIIYDCDADNNDGKNDGAGEDNLKSSDCGWRYLEAAPTDAGTYKWGSNLSLGTGSEIGDGWKNMVKFMDEVGGLANFPAAEACDKYSVTVGGVTYDDWFLPSYDELDLMVKINLSQTDYFSSSEYGSDKVWHKWWNDYWGGQFNSGFSSKSDSERVRPVRAFLTWNKTNPPTLTNPTPKYAVTFELNGGTGTVDTQTVKKGRTATKPATNPKKDGCIFDKWTKSDGTEYNFGDAVSENITLYAKWITPAVNDIVTLGTVSWKVLEVDTTNKRALLISENVLELCSFDYDTIRSYLNNRETEDGFIKKYGLENVDMCTVDVSGDKTTVDNTKSDKLFLFSRVDAGYPSKTSSLGTATYNGRNYSWWLRTTNVYTGNILHVSIVNENGYISECNLSTDNSQKGLRPAFWIDLNVSK